VKLYLVFEFMQMDLKKYIDTVQGQLDPMLVKVGGLRERVHYVAWSMGNTLGMCTVKEVFPQFQVTYNILVMSVTPSHSSPAGRGECTMYMSLLVWVVFSQVFVCDR